MGRKRTTGPMVIKKKIVTRAFAGKVKKYAVYELHKVYRPENNKKKVVSKYVAYLGKDPKSPEARARVERAKQEGLGFFATDRLVKRVSREMKKSE